MSTHAIGILAGVLLLAACEEAPLEGGSRIAPEVYWRLHVLGEDEARPAATDSVLLRVRIARPGAPPGTLFSTERWYAMGSAPASALHAERMSAGDSATLLLPARRLPWAALGATAPPLGSDTGWAQVEIALREVRSLQQSRERARALLMARTQADEERILDAFFRTEPHPWRKSMGIWYQLDSLPQGPQVQSGDVVLLAYTASFLDDGRVFDDQSVPEGGLLFRLGDPGQVIKGLEAAVRLLPRAGGSGRFIIPSELAFGPTGSSSGIVPPWTPVCYAVTVLPPAGAAGS